jgi:L-lactate dehydrogenase complex protein LldE
MKVQLLATCLIDSLFPEVGEAAVEVLSKAGTAVEFPAGQTCCGQPALNAGMLDEARAMAVHTLEVFDGDRLVVVPSGSCADTIKHRYLDLVRGDRKLEAKAQSLAERTHELSQFVVDQLLVSDLEAANSRFMAYHPSCHTLRGLGVDRQPVELLQQVEGASILRLEPECCGFGGLFAIDHAEISNEMLRSTIERIERSGAEAVVGCDASCLMHIEGGLRRAGSNIRCSHVAQVLAGKAPGLR